METFTEPKELEDNPHFHDQRREILAGLSDGMIDIPMVEIVKGFNSLPYCFTLQCCYGHFLHDDQKDPHNFKPLPVRGDITRVEYRIAYIAFCIENNSPGRILLDALRDITVFDPENIQLCCADWVWKRQVNSYALQVEPDRLKDQDKVVLDYREALKIEKTRNGFFIQLKNLIQDMQDR